MNSINAFRAIVRPIMILFCTGILGTLVLIEASSGLTITSEIGKEIVYSFIAITGILDLEYVGERAVRHYRADSAKIKKEVQ